MTQHQTLDAVQAALLGRDLTATHQGIVDVVGRAGLCLVGIGSHRVAVEIDGGLVAKVAHRPIGLRDNEIELRVYRRADAQLRDLLCPVLHLSPGGAVLARRCLPLSASPGDLTVSDTIRRLAGAGISDAAANLGLLDGRIVCYDYAQISARLLSFVAR